MKIGVIGAGYVGLTTAACLSHLGHVVHCTDVSRSRIDCLLRGELPIVEEGLDDLVRDGLESGRLTFSLDNAACSRDAEIVFLCVPTPQGEDGNADTQYVDAAVKSISRALPSDSIVVSKSTVPVGSTEIIERVLGRNDVKVVSNPEFLREGTAVHDFLHPDRIVIGSIDRAAALKVAALYDADVPIVLTDPASAETIKYASNAFLATKLSFANALAALCEAVGANVTDVILGLGKDRRIGPDFLKPGPGWGGSCLPKDTQALVQLAAQAGYDFDLINSAIAVNEEQIGRVVGKIAMLAGGVLYEKTIGVLGLTFKAGTDDLRDSPALRIVEKLIAAKAKVQAYDPTVDPRTAAPSLSSLTALSDPYDVARGADVLVIATEWQEFRLLHPRKLADLMVNPALVDARNLLDPATMRDAGFTYAGIGIR